MNPQTSSSNNNLKLLSTGIQKKPPVPLAPRPLNGVTGLQRQPFGQSAQANMAQRPTLNTGQGGMMKDMKSQQMRAQLNQTNGNFNSKIQQVKAGMVAMKPGSSQKAFVPQRAPIGNVVHHQLETEISVIYSLYKKTMEMLSSAQTQQQQAKLATTFDVEKWRKKFFLVFTRDRGTLDISQNPALPVDIKNVTLNPQTTSRVSDRILKTNVKFWIIYIHAIAERLNDFAKATLRARLLGNPGEPSTGLFSAANHQAEYDLLIKEVGSIIDAEKLHHINSEETQDDAQPLPVFGSQANQPFEDAQVHQIEVLGTKNETFTENQAGQPAFVIDSPSEEYLVNAPVQMSRRSLKGTPKFQENEDSEQFHDAQDFEQDQQEEQDNEPEEPQEHLDPLQNEEICQDYCESLEEDGQDCVEQQDYLEQLPQDNAQKGDLTFYTCHNEEVKQGLPNVTFDQNLYTTAVQFDVQDQEIQFLDQEEPLLKELHLDDNDNQNPIEESNEDLIVHKEVSQIQVENEQEEEIQVNDQVEQEQLEYQEEKNEELANEQEKEEIKQEDTIIDQKTIETEEQRVVLNEGIPIKEEIEIQPNPELEAFMKERQEQIVNPKKRKRSPSGAQSCISQTGMTLRSRFKQRKLNESDDGCVSQIGDEDRKEELAGSSYIRYEIIEKKGKQILVPVRYSIRRAAQLQQNISTILENQEVELERQILNQEIDFEYQPNEQLEGLFTLDQGAQEIRKLLLQSLQEGKREFERVRVQISDIQEIVLVSEQGDFALVKVKKDIREKKYSNHSHVGVSLISSTELKQRGRKGLKKRNEAQMREMMEHLLKTKRRIRTGVMFTQASDEAIEHIKRTYQPPSMRVTRLQAAATGVKL